MDTPSPDDVRARSPLLTERFPSPAEDEALTLILADLAPIISQLTGRAIGPDGTPGDEVPDWLRPTAVRVFTLRAERDSTGLTAAARSAAATANGAVRLKSFSAGPYSESYFGPGEAMAAGILDPDPLIHEALWTLATEAMRNYWLRLWGKLQPEPASAFVTPNWLGRRPVRTREDPPPLGA